MTTIKYEIDIPVEELSDDVEIIIFKNLNGEIQANLSAIRKNQGVKILGILKPSSEKNIAGARMVEALSVPEYDVYLKHINGAECSLYSWDENEWRVDITPIVAAGDNEEPTESTNFNSLNKALDFLLEGM